ncbi:hypothetical protein GCM10009525_83080 [Streptosporangium amethystogenes subsp. fukuiense]
MSVRSRSPHTVDLRQRAREWIEGFHQATKEDQVNCVALLLCAADDAYDCAAEGHKRRLTESVAVGAQDVG